MIQLTLTLKMTTAQVVETSVTVNNNSPIQDYAHPDDQTQPFEMTPGFKPFTDSHHCHISCWLHQLSWTNKNIKNPNSAQQLLHQSLLKDSLSEFGKVKKRSRLRNTLSYFAFKIHHCPSAVFTLETDYPS